MSAPASHRDDRWFRLVAFVVIMFGLTWAPAAALEPLWAIAAEPASSRLLRASVLYACFMTLQPLIALLVLRYLVGDVTVDLGVRQPGRRWHALAIVGPLALAAAAAALAVLLRDSDRAAEALRPALDPQLTGDGSRAFYLLFAFVGAICLLWVQAMTEEIGWRGYFLPRLMRALGPWIGLFAHGALWGLWYAPLLVVTTGTGPSSLARCASFVVTCSLLGVLLGWIRIAARSVLVAASANATLTICAALPMFLHDTSAARTSIYLPVGWIPLGLTVLAVLASRHRITVREFVDRSP